MLESRIWKQTLLASGTITFTLGLIISALGAESLAVYNACFANPGCLPGISGMNFEGFFGILVAGIILGMAGAVLLLVGLRLSRRSAGHSEGLVT
jgi:hypothetical protein